MSTAIANDRNALIRGYRTRAEADAVVPNIIDGLVTDSGENVSPRYRIIIVPKVGDEVSYGFNGDYYPDGTIVAISASLRVITTSTGRRYFRRRESARWVNNGTWTLVQGHIDERNPHF